MNAIAQSILEQVQTIPAGEPLVVTVPANVGPGELEDALTDIMAAGWTIALIAHLSHSYFYKLSRMTR